MSETDPPPPPQEPKPVMPLEYGPPGTRSGAPQGGNALLRYLAGLGAGVAVSLVTWDLGWNTFFAHPGGGQAALLVVPGAKVVGTIVSMFFPGWRAFGAGLLSSIALGVLIFFGSCVYHFRG